MKTKFKLKTLNSGTLGKALTAGVLACVLSCGAVMPVNAATLFNDGSLYGLGSDAVRQILINRGVEQQLIGWSNIRIKEASVNVLINPQTGAITTRLSYTYIDNALYYDDPTTYTFSGSCDLTDTELSQLGINDRSKLSGGTTYSAGNGITISSDNKVYV